MWSNCIVLLFIVNVRTENCGNKAWIKARGINQQSKTLVVNQHNSLRMMIATGQVPGEPRGVNLKRLSYDNQLEKEARVVSDTCVPAHIIANDTRWFAIGQNIFLECNSLYSSYQNWTRAIQAWFDEYTLYTFPGGFSHETGHYTQVVWADTNMVGCDYIMFYDYNLPQMPWCKLYTCNYGPAGNVNNWPPYQVGTSGCENLC